MCCVHLALPVCNAAEQSTATWRLHAADACNQPASPPLCPSQSPLSPQGNSLHVVPSSTPALLPSEHLPAAYRTAYAPGCAVPLSLQYTVPREVRHLDPGLWWGQAALQQPQLSLLLLQQQTQPVALRQENTGCCFSRQVVMESM